MSEIINLESESLPDNCYVFKNSTACPISHAAASEIKNATAILPVYWINVIEQRVLSNWFAAHYNVVHQSPQLILVKDGSANKVWSHSEIKKDLLD